MPHHGKSPEGTLAEDKHVLRALVPDSTVRSVTLVPIKGKEEAMGLGARSTSHGHLFSLKSEEWEVSILTTAPSRSPLPSEDARPPYGTTRRSLWAKRVTGGI